MQKVIIIASLRKLALIAAIFLSGCISASGASTPTNFDILIRNGRIVDGTGTASIPGDVAIRNGHIVAMGRINGSAKQTLDATGLVVAPGFIDIHNHSGANIVVDGNAESMVRQGVTSMIIGEGGSPAPSEEYREFNDYFQKIIAQGISTNIGSYLGSNAVWRWVRGDREDAPSEKDTEAVLGLIHKAMQQGALGLSSSLLTGRGELNTDTLVEMCKVVGEYGGIYSTHTRNEGLGVFKAVEEALEIGRRSDVPVDILHFKIAAEPLWGRMPELANVVADARKNGQYVTVNVYPYHASQNSLARGVIAPWAREGGKEKMLARFDDPEMRKRIIHDAENGIPGRYNYYLEGGGWSRMLLIRLENPAYKKYEGKFMSEIIEDLGMEPFDALFQILRDNGGDGRVYYFHHTEEDMQHVLTLPFASIGSDGRAVKTSGPLAKSGKGPPHPRYYGTFPRVLGRYVREEKLLSLEEAVQKMTSANANKIGIFDRGILRPGLKADVTVFNPETVIDNASFRDPHHYPTGIEYVIVNGKIVIAKGTHTGARPGQILYGPGWRKN